MEKSVSGTVQQRNVGGIIGAVSSKVSGNAYPIFGSVVSFLKEDTLKLSISSATGPVPEPLPDSSIKRQVKKWYDEF
ncbi:MAG: hypothetical protein ACRD3T_22060, partial [Terriglobia bacterium]